MPPPQPRARGACPAARLAELVQSWRTGWGAQPRAAETCEQIFLGTTLCMGAQPKAAVTVES
eukprot:9356528-Pyramimonas_sp.AAC.1